MVNKNIMFFGSKLLFNKYNGLDLVKSDDFGENIGDVLFLSSLVKHLKNSGYNVTPFIHADLYRDDIDTIVASYANLFYSGNLKLIDNLTQLINLTKKNFIVCGIGCQSEYGTFKIETNNVSLNKAVKNFVGAVLSHSASIGVRGSITYEYLTKILGFSSNEVDIIGCPSISYYGRQFSRIYNITVFNESSKIAVNYTLYHPIKIVYKYLNGIFRNFPRSFALMQDLNEAELLHYMKPIAVNYDTELPVNAEHMVIKEKRARFCGNEEEWIGCLRTFDFSIGTRIHGNIAAVLANIPVMVVCQDSRTLELADYFNLPHMLYHEINDSLKLEKLYYKSVNDMKKFYDAYDEKLLDYEKFMEKNGAPVNLDFTAGNKIINIDASPVRIDTPEKEKKMKLSRQPKYLISHGSPFEHENIDERVIVEKNMFGNNIGNDLFFNATVRAISDAPQNECFHLYQNNTHINDFDCVILPLANVIRSSSATVNEMAYYHGLLANSKTPFIINGVGSDSYRDKIDASPEIIEKTKLFFADVLDRTPSIGVRGEQTYKLCVNEMGLPKDRIKVIGCPSVRYFGKKFKKHSGQYKEFTPETKIAVYFTAYIYDNDEAIFFYNILKKHKRSFVIFTDKVEAELLWYKKPVSQSRLHDLYPTYTSHFILQEGRARFFATQKKIMGCLCTFDFSIGTRIHGAIASILSGVPAILISSSIRTLEIAQYHNIPYITRSELIALNENHSLEILYYRACLGMKKFYDAYDEKFLEYTVFLTENGLRLSKDFI